MYEYLGRVVRLCSLHRLDQQVQREGNLIPDSNTPPKIKIKELPKFWLSCNIGGVITK